MTLRPDTIRERLAPVRKHLAELTTTAKLPRDAFLNDRKEQWAAAYALQVAVQALLDAGAHVLSGHFKESPREYGDIVPQLVRCRVLDAELGDRLKGYEHAGCTPAQGSCRGNLHRSVKSSSSGVRVHVQ